MPSQIQTPSEAAEIQAVLSSETFSDAPNMARLLKYLSDNYFNGKKESLNEYRIGVEALGRPSDFDPAKNSSVRVEMHRLRGKLRKYYESEGADHACWVLLTDGHYGLQFVRQEGASVAGSQVEKPKGSFIPNVSMTGLAIALLAVVILAVSLWALVEARSRKGLAHSAEAPAPSVVGAASAGMTESGPIRILAGYKKEKYVDREGRIWGADRYFTGGDVVEPNFPFIQGTADPTMYRTARVGEFSYDIPVKPGTYELRLHFAETTFGPGTGPGGGESSRVFSVFLGERPLVVGLDVLSDAGGNDRALTRVFKGVSAGPDGMVHLRFRSIKDQPLVNAIELVPEINGRMNPVRIVMQQSSFVDRDGNLWTADRYAVGGMLSAHRDPVVNSADPHLYDGERYGNFTYQIPVPPGRYTVALHFTEAYFGTENAWPEAAGRLFDVEANGVALLRNFNIFEKAGGSNIPVTETFHGIEPNAAGLIVLRFVPVKNYACIDAIEVTDESQ
jgi:hypothetical protein